MMLDLRQGVVHGPTDADYLQWRESPGRVVEVVDVQAGSARREGIGRRMVGELLGVVPDGTRLIFARTRATNAIARQWYEALGFRVLGMMDRFYRDDPDSPGDAIVFGIDLEPQ